MTQPPLKTRRELVADAVRRIITYTDEIAWFGSNSTVGALAQAIGGQASLTYRLYKGVLRRFSLRAATGDWLDVVAAERGADRLDAQRARVLVVFRPVTATVSAIDETGPTVEIDVDDATGIEAGDSVRIINEDGSLTERLTVSAVTEGGGASGADLLEVPSLANTYTPSTETVSILLRHRIEAETELTTEAGVGLQIKQAVTIGDLNPLLAGEGTALALLDKAWAEATIAGASGNIDPQSITGFVIPDAKVASVQNPERGFGGADEESDEDLRFRAAHRPARRSQTTEAWAEALARESQRRALRMRQEPADEVSTMQFRILARNGGPLTEKQRRAVENYIEARTRAYMGIRVLNVELTSVEVEAQVKLDPDVTLRQAWIDAASRISDYIDYRRWEWGDDVSALELRRRLELATGIESVVVGSFLPAADVEVADTSLPAFVRLSLEDVDTGRTINGTLAQTFDDSTDLS